MESYSRVKKYQALRETVENNQEDETISPALSSFAERLNKINPVLSKLQTKTQDAEYQAHHVKRVVQFKDADDLAPNPNIKTDYIHEFLDEVRQYNVEQGYRKDFDTERDVIKAIKDVPIDEPDSDAAVQEITQQIQTLMEESELEEPDFKSLEPSLEETYELQVVLEETQKMKVKLDDYEKELADMSASVLTSNKLLNYVVFALVLLLMIMLGFAIYWVLYSQGYY